MTYTKAIEKIAYIWDRAVRNSETGELSETSSSMIYGMIKMLAIMENKAYFEVSQDVIEFGHEHGILLFEEL